MPRPEFDPVGGVLELEPRAANTEDRPASGHVVEGRNDLRDEAGVAERIGPD